MDPLEPQAGTDIKEVVRDAFDLSLDRGKSICFSFNKAVVSVNPELDARIATTNGRLTREQHETLQLELSKVAEELKKEEENNK